MMSFIGIYISLVVLIRGTLLWNPMANHDKLPVCRTAMCAKRASIYLADMDQLADPCQDFYQFACGSWLEVTPKPDFYMDWSVQQFMTLEAQVKMKETLMRPIDPTEPALQRKMKALYQFCVDKPHMPKGSMSYVYNGLNSINRYTVQNSVWLYHDTLLKMTGDSAFFSYTVSVTEQDNYMPFLEINLPLSVYGSIYHVPVWTPTETHNYALFLEDIYRAYHTIIELPLDEQRMLSEIKALIEFRRELNKIALDRTQSKQDKDNPKTVSEVQGWYNMIYLHSVTTKINWERIALVLYGKTAYELNRNKPILAIRGKRYFSALAELLSVTPVATIINHMQIYFVERQLIYTERMKDKLENAILVADKQTGFVREDMPRWLSCLEMDDVRHEIGRIYADFYFNKNTIKPVDTLIKDMRNLLKKEIFGSRWLQGNSRLETVKGIDSVKPMIGYPEWYFNPLQKVDRVFPLPSRANAVFDMLTKKLYIAANLMRSPMFDVGVPEVLNIGALGATIGHELHHMFGDCGVLPGIGNHISRYLPWWTPDVREYCNQKKKCFVEMYNEYARKKLAGIVSPTDIDATRTFMEDVADVMGLQLAYRYYKIKFPERTARCETIPLFEDYSCDQMFYLAYANSMCGTSDPKYLNRKYKYLLHNDRSIRINGAVMNDKNFARAFNCVPNLPMNPSRKCNLWN